MANFVPARLCCLITLLTTFRSSEQQDCNSTTEFECSTGQCLSASSACDYYDDCLDNSDEENCAFPIADNSTVLLYTTGNQNLSVLWKLFGNPDDYATKLSDPTCSGSLPIHINYIWIDTGDYYGAFAVDYDTRSLYFNNRVANTIEYGPFVYRLTTTPTSKMAVDFTPSHVKGMSFDWLSKNLYWTNGDLILVTNFAKSKNVYTKTVVDASTVNTVEDVAVDALQRYLFWFDAGTFGYLFRTDLAGNNGANLTIRSLATRLALDCTAQIVYFLDAASGRLAAIRYDGTSYRLLGTFSGYGSLAVHSSFVFLGNSERSVIKIVQKATAMSVSNFTSYEGSGPITDIKVFSRRSQPAGSSVCSTNNGNCSQLCIADSETTRQCQCQNGNSLSYDGLSCEDCDPKNEFLCMNANCVNTNEVCDYYDDCFDGSDEANCGFPPADNETALVFTNDYTDHSAFWTLLGNPDDYVSKLANSSFAGQLPIRVNYIWKDDSKYFGRIAVDYDTGTVYFSNSRTNTLEYGPLIYQNELGSSILDTVTVTPKQLTGMAFDWLSKNLYWTNGQLIAVTKENDRVNTKTIFRASTVSAVQSIEVDSVQRYLFWCDSTVPNRIIRADLTGANRVNLTLTWTPTRLTLDPATQSVYFLEPNTGRLGYFRYDGTGYVALGRVTRRGSLAVQSSYLFIGDTSNPVIYIVNKTSGNPISNFAAASTGGITGMKMFSRESQPAGTSPCATDNGGCSDLCFPTSTTTRVCACDDTRTLSPDGLTCQDCHPATQFLCRNGNCIDRFGVCDYYDDCLDNSDEQNCGFPVADNSTALVYTNNNTDHSALWTLFGNPDDYADQLANSSVGNRLPIHLSYIIRSQSDFYGLIALDCQTGTVYFSNGNKDSLDYGLLIYQTNGRNSSAIYNVTVTPKEVKGMDLDWSSKNLYWTNGKSIMVTTTRQRVYTKTLVPSTTSSDVLDIAVDPIQRYLFWYDSSTPDYLIRSDLGGNNRTNLTVDSPATKLALDFAAQTVYFLDTTSGQLASIGYDGTFYTLLGNFSRRGSIAVHSSILFLGDTRNPVIYVHDKASGSVISNFTTLSTGPIIDIAMFSRETQPTVTSPCSTNNGGCEEICFSTSETSRVCQCQDSKTLASDGVTCEVCHSLTEFLCQNRKCIDRRSLCDYYDDCLDNSDELDCGFPDVDNSTALVLVNKDPDHSAVWTLFGNPDDYAGKLANSSFRNALPIHLSFIWNPKRTYFVGVAVDYNESAVYYINGVQNSVQYGPILNQSSVNDLLALRNGSYDLNQVTSVAFDWLSKNLYWTTGSAIVVTTTTTDVRIKVILPSNQYSVVNDMAVDPIHGVMFWHESTSLSFLTRATLAGTGRIKIPIKSQAKKLALDCTARTVYFLDPTSGRLASIRYDGTSYRLLGTFSGRGSIAVHSSYLFLGDTTDPVIFVHKTSGVLISNFTAMISGPITDVKMFSRESQPAGISPCVSDNGGCNEFCFTASPTERVCDCENGKTLSPDGVNCTVPSGSPEVIFDRWVVGLSTSFVLFVCLW